MSAANTKGLGPARKPELVAGVGSASFGGRVGVGGKVGTGVGPATGSGVGSEAGDRVGTGPSSSNGANPM